MVRWRETAFLHDPPVRVSRLREWADGGDCLARSATGRTSTLSWNQAIGITTLSSFGFSSTSLSAYLCDDWRPPSPDWGFPRANRLFPLECACIRPKAADLDKITANIRANNGRVRPFGPCRHGRAYLPRSCNPPSALLTVILAAVVLHQALVQRDQCCVHRLWFRR